MTIVVTVIIPLVLASAWAFYAAKHYKASTDSQSGFKNKGRVNPAHGFSITTHSQQATKSRKVKRQERKVKKQKEIA